MGREALESPAFPGPSASSPCAGEQGIPAGRSGTETAETGAVHGPGPKALGEASGRKARPTAPARLIPEDRPGARTILSPKARPIIPTGRRWTRPNIAPGRTPTRSNPRRPTPSTGRARGADEADPCDKATLRLWCMDRRCKRIASYPRHGLRDPDVLWATELEHALQHACGDRHLGRLPVVRGRVRARAHAGAAARGNKAKAAGAYKVEGRASAAGEGGQVSISAASTSGLRLMAAAREA